MAFGRDMVLPMIFQADWESIRERRMNQIQANARRENQLKIPHECKVGDKVLVRRPGIQPKLNPPRDGPYAIEQVNANGTIVIRKGAISERINIRRVIPYFE